MISNTIYQTKLHSFEDQFKNFVNLYNNGKLPNKILLSGQKGIGKSTFAYHLINYILSKNEDFSYNLSDFLINKKSATFKLIHNGTNPNFKLINIESDKKFINVDQIRDLIKYLEKSSFNTKPRFVLVDNIENLNLNSVNAFLKILEEPPKNTFFILINSDKRILLTLKSRCLNFRMFLSNQKSTEVINKILGLDIFDLINKDLLNYYDTPGRILDLLDFAQKNKIDLKNLDLRRFLILIIDESLYKKENRIKDILYEFSEIFLLRKIRPKYSYIVNYFLEKIENTKKFNLDDESLFIELKKKVLNG